MNTSSSGRLPASVYRRRRITVAVVALLVLGLLVWGVTAGLSALRGQPEGDQAQPTQNAQPQDPNAAAPSQDASAEPEGMCAESQLEVTASTDANSYTADANPVLILGVKNISESDCQLNVGTSQQEFLVSSGSDRIFSTNDCAQDPQDVMLQLKAGQEESARFSWPRERSAPGCKAVNVPPRPGTYKFTAILGEIESEPKTFELK